MGNWLQELVRDLTRLTRHGLELVAGPFREASVRERRLRLWGLGGALGLVVMALLFASLWPHRFEIPDVQLSERGLPDLQDLMIPVRAEPDRFRANTYRPKKREGKASISIGRSPFVPLIDLVRIEDERVWWESEHDRGDTEDDHLFHWAMEEPMRRLIELIGQADGMLKVQDAYRPEGIHATHSLHKQGRAVDLTADGLSLERLAKLSWAAGFDWVYYESPKRGGAHIHASVRPDGVCP